MTGRPAVGRFGGVGDPRRARQTRAERVKPAPSASDPRRARQTRAERVGPGPSAFQDHTRRFWYWQLPCKDGGMVYVCTFHPELQRSRGEFSSRSASVPKTIHSYAPESRRDYTSSANSG
jgi:hypothetical protein